MVRGPVRSLTPGQAQRLTALRKVARLLDSAVVIPGTSYRIGLDPVLGIIPGVGDLVSPLFSIALLWQARDLDIPRIVQIRMVVNVAIDAFVGLVPVIGDLFDFAWKANARNLELLEAHASVRQRASVGDWLFVSTIIVIVFALAAIPVALTGWLLAALGRTIF